ncbi:MAG: hypothetical protein LUE17_14060 [Planctomycetaceae bacterium]|nr:hypothetical protein [Planctomycetaceae bacterium]
MDRRIGVIAALYGGFFAVWCIGLIFGEVWTGPAQPFMAGMPLWFLIGCVVSFVAVSVALAYCLWRRVL